jgi:hypothetical protein
LLSFFAVSEAAACEVEAALGLVWGFGGASNDAGSSTWAMNILSMMCTLAIETSRTILNSQQFIHQALVSQLR